MADYRPLVYKKVYLPLCTVADTPFHIQGDVMFTPSVLHNIQVLWNNIYYLI